MDSNDGNPSERELDARYKPFASFSDWVKSAIENERWERIVQTTENLKSHPPEALEESRKVVQRAAAVDTGAIEGLYRTDRNFTITIAMNTAIQRAPPEGDPLRFRVHFEAQLNALDYVLDFATRQRPMAESWIRELHAVVCKGQDTYLVRTAVGDQVQPLPKGEYKHHPNHVQTAAGEIHAWAPVSQASAEMARLVMELTSDGFEAADAILQAAYAHHAFVSIHPFADGNGRVSRALASVFTYRGLSTPILIFDDQAEEYFEALEEADSGNPRQFVEFLADRVEEALEIQKEALDVAVLGSESELANELDHLYPSDNSSQARELQQAGAKLMELTLNVLRHIVREEVIPGKLSYALIIEGEKQVEKDQSLLVGSPRAFRFFAKLDHPHSHQAYLVGWISISQQDQTPMIHLRAEGLPSLDLHPSEILPEPSPTVTTRVGIWAEGLRRQAVNKVIGKLPKSID